MQRSPSFRDAAKTEHLVRRLWQFEEGVRKIAVGKDVKFTANSIRKDSWDAPPQSKSLIMVSLDNSW